MYKTIIIDDEPHAVKVLSLMLEQHCPEAEKVGTADNISDGYKLIIELTPDLVFLDINMPNGSGLDLLKRIQHLKIAVILTTAHHEFAIDALRLSAADYLLKPIAKDELRSAMDRINNKIVQSDSSKPDQSIENTKISIKTVDGLTILNLDEIEYVQSDKNYSIFFNKGSEIISSKPLGEYEEVLLSPSFIRIHRSTIVSVSHIRELKKGKNWSVVLTSGKMLEVARSKRDEISQLLNDL